MDLVRTIEKENMKDKVAQFKVGDTLKVHYKIIEGKNERIQVFEGVCIARKGSSMHQSFTVRKISYGVGVERVFPVHSPKVEKVELIRMGKVRRSKLYYLRTRFGKAAKVTELIQKHKKKNIILEQQETPTTKSAE